MEEFFRTIMRASIPLGSKDSSIAGGSVWTERENMLKNKSVLSLTMILVFAKSVLAQNFSAHLRI